MAHRIPSNLVLVGRLITMYSSIGDWPIREVIVRSPKIGEFNFWLRILIKTISETGETVK